MGPKAPPAQHTGRPQKKQHTKKPDKPSPQPESSERERRGACREGCGGQGEGRAAGSTDDCLATPGEHHHPLALPIAGLADGPPTVVGRRDALGGRAGDVLGLARGGGVGARGGARGAIRDIDALSAGAQLELALRRARPAPSSADARDLALQEDDRQEVGEHGAAEEGREGRARHRCESSLEPEGGGWGVGRLELEPKRPYTHIYIYIYIYIYIDILYIYHKGDPRLSEYS